MHTFLWSYSTCDHSTNCARLISGYSAIWPCSLNLIYLDLYLSTQNYAKYRDCITVFIEEPGQVPTCNVYKDHQWLRNQAITKLVHCILFLIELFGSRIIKIDNGRPKVYLTNFCGIPTLLFERPEHSIVSCTYMYSLMYYVHEATHYLCVKMSLLRKPYFHQNMPYTIVQNRDILVSCGNKWLQTLHISSIIVIWVLFLWVSLIQSKIQSTIVSLQQSIWLCHFCYLFCP